MLVLTTVIGQPLVITLIKVVMVDEVSLSTVISLTAIYTIITMASLVCVMYTFYCQWKGSETRHANTLTIAMEACITFTVAENI